MVSKLHLDRCLAVSMIQSAKGSAKGQRKCSSVHSALEHDASHVVQLPLLFAVVATWYVGKEAVPRLVADTAVMEFDGEAPHEA